MLDIIVRIPKIEASELQKLTVSKPSCSKTSTNHKNTKPVSKSHNAPLNGQTPRVRPSLPQNRSSVSQSRPSLSQNRASLSQNRASLPQNRKDDIRKRKIEEINPPTPELPLSEIDARLQDRKSLRLLGVEPEKFDLPEYRKVVKNGEESVKKVQKPKSALKRRIPSSHENTTAKQMKLMKSTGKCNSSFSGVRRNVSFLLGEKGNTKRDEVPAKSENERRNTRRNETQAKSGNQKANTTKKNEIPAKVVTEKGGTRKTEISAKPGKDPPRDLRENELSNRRKTESDSNRSDGRSQSCADTVSTSRAEPKAPLLPIRSYQKTVDVWYECDCCHQKYLLLEHIKNHVRSHFPNCLTS